MRTKRADITKTYSLLISSKVGNLLINSRPILLSKTLLIMFFGAYLASGGFPEPFMRLIYAFIIVGPILWSGLYSLGNYFDAEIDKLDSRKANRPLVNGDLSKRGTLIWSLILISLGLLLAHRSSGALLLICVLMLVSQFLYAFPGIRLKAVAYGDILLVGILNPSLRFLAGWLLFNSSLAIPILPMLFLWLFHISGVLTRGLLNRDFEKSIGFQSTSVRHTRKGIAMVAALTLAIALLVFLIMCISGALNLKMTGVAPVFLPLIIFPIIGLRDFLKLIRHPDPNKLDGARTKGWSYVTIALLYVLTIVAIKTLI